MPLTICFGTYHRPVFRPHTLLSNCVLRHGHRHHMLKNIHASKIKNFTFTFDLAPCAVEKVTTWYFIYFAFIWLLYNENVNKIIRSVHNL